MKKWLILFFSIIIVSESILLILSLKATPASAGVNLSAHISSICGNGLVEPGEQCDGVNLNGKTCIDLGLGYIGGTLSCYAVGWPDECLFNTSACTSPAPTPPPPGGGGAPLPDTGTRVILQGLAYPSAKITVLVDAKVYAYITADSSANFKATISDIAAGTYNFGLWAEDKYGRKSITFSFTITVIKGMTITVSGIFLPPTIELDKVNLDKGEDLTIFGQTAPKSQLSVHVESPQEIIQETTADKTGDWQLLFSTAVLEEGTHTVRAKAESQEELLSSFSRVLLFYVGRYGVDELCPRADFNKDGRTNLVDFSIMLYWWGKANACIDQNKDGIVNLPDFSILMYWWTG